MDLCGAIMPFSSALWRKAVSSRGVFNILGEEMHFFASAFREHATVLEGSLARDRLYGSRNWTQVQ